MSQNAYPSRSNQPAEVTHRIRLLGADGAAPTVETGAAGLSVTRAGEGDYALVWAENPGTFVGWQVALGAATPGDVKNYSVIRDTYAASTRTLPFIVYSGGGVAADIVANQYLDIAVTFKRSSVEG